MSAVARSIADEVAVVLGRPAERARALLRRNGLRCTVSRVAVLAVLAAAATDQSHRTAYEIHAAIAADGIEIDLTTVYRTLSTLHAKGIIHQVAVVESPASYGLAEHPHHHAVCTACSAVTEVIERDFVAALERAERSTLFTFAVTGSITLWGLCPACQGRLSG